MTLGTRGVFFWEKGGTNVSSGNRRYGPRGVFPGVIFVFGGGGSRGGVWGFGGVVSRHGSFGVLRSLRGPENIGRGTRSVGTLGGHGYFVLHGGCTVTGMGRGHHKYNSGPR